MNRLLLTLTILACLVVGSMQQDDTCFTTDCKLGGELPEGEVEKYEPEVCKIIKDFQECLATTESCKTNEIAVKQVDVLASTIDEKCAGSFVQASVLITSLAVFFATRFL